MLGLEDTFTAQDLQVMGCDCMFRRVWLSSLAQHVDPVMARSFAQLAEVAVKKHNLERDSLLVRLPTNTPSCHKVLLSC